MRDVTWAEDGTAVVTLSNVKGVLGRYRYRKATDRFRRAVTTSGPGRETPEASGGGGLAVPQPPGVFGQ
jgi:hypothetical protein